MAELTRINPGDLNTFLRRYRLAGGRIRRVKLIARSKKNIAVEIRLRVREAIQDLGTDPKQANLTLRLEGVDEYRFQMRPAQPRVTITEARIRHLNGLFYVNLDAWDLDPGEQPQVHDFRASEAYAAGRDLLWG